MPPFLHGLSLADPDGANRLRFGFARFLGFIVVEQLFPIDRPREPWPYRRIDRRFQQASRKVGDTIHKIDRVASWYGRAATRLKSESRTEEFPLMAALDDIHIYLDSLLVYLRILADTLANVTPYLYPPSGSGPPGDSFRKLRKWFATTRNNIDLAFSALLASETVWFDDLAGRSGTGLREVVIHFRGTFQTSVITDPPELRGTITPGLIGDRGYLVDDVSSSLNTIVTNLCRFLDGYVSHHLDRIHADSGWRVMDLSRPHVTELYRFQHLPDSAWLFPVRGSLIEPRGA